MSRSAGIDINESSQLDDQLLETCLHNDRQEVDNPITRETTAWNLGFVESVAGDSPRADLSARWALGADAVAKRLLIMLV